MARDFSRFDPSEASLYKRIHNLSSRVSWPSAASSFSNPVVKSLPGYVYVGGGTSTDITALYSKDGSLNLVQDISFGGSSVIGSLGKCFVHSDILLAGSSNSVSWYGMNLRQNGVARNINNTAALAGVRPLSPWTVTGHGWVAMPNLSPAFYHDMAQWEDERYLVGVSTENTTSPVVTSPAVAPTCVASTTGGYLAAGNFDVAYAWVTRLNTRRSGQGITLPSPTQAGVVVGGATTGSIAVTIPAAPSNVTGYVVYVVSASGTLRAVGGGIALAGGTTHTVKATMAQLAMSSKLAYSGSSQMIVGSIVNLEAASPITWGTARAFTPGFTGLYWSPFQKDITQLYTLNQALNTTTTLKADKYDLVAGTIALNQTITADGEPTYINHASNTILGTSAPNCIRMIPEMMAYAIGAPATNTAGQIVTGGLIQIRSCLTNEILKTYTDEDLNGYATTGYSGYQSGWFDFEAVDGAVDLLGGSRKYRGVVRMPIMYFS